MLLGVLGFGAVSGLLAGWMAWQTSGSILLAVGSYSLFGALGAVLYGTATALRGHDAEQGDLTHD